MATNDGPSRRLRFENAVEPTELGHHDRLVTLQLRPGVVAPEAGDREVHEARVLRREIVVAEAHPFGDARAPRLDHDVGTRRERAGHAGVVGVLQVEDDAALATGPERPRRLASGAHCLRAARRARRRHRSRPAVGRRAPRSANSRSRLLADRPAHPSWPGSVRGPALAGGRADDIERSVPEEQEPERRSRAGRAGPERTRRHWVAFTCLAVLVACGVATFVGLQGTVHDLDRSLTNFYDDTQFADVVVVGGETDAFADAARDVPGVAAVATRTTTTLSIWIDGGKTKVQGTVIGVPSTGPPINALSITAGKAFAPRHHRERRRGRAAHRRRSRRRARCVRGGARHRQRRGAHGHGRRGVAGVPHARAEPTAGRHHARELRGGVRARGGGPGVGRRGGNRSGAGAVRERGRRRRARPAADPPRRATTRPRSSCRARSSPRTR